MKKNILVFLCAFLPIICFSDSTDPSVTAKDYIIINLGENCSARAVLEGVQIKQESYPFDSCIIPFQGLIKCLEEDFQDYTNPDYFTPYIDKQSPVNKYGIVLSHSFPLTVIGKKENGDDLLILDPNWREVLPTVQEKYKRRITRFRDACRSNKKVCFFRYLDISPNGAKQLSQLIKTIYPNLEFVLVCVENTTSSSTRKSLKRRDSGIRYYYYNVDEKDALEEWKKIFQDAGLI